MNQNKLHSQSEFRKESVVGSYGYMHYYRVFIPCEEIEAAMNEFEQVCMLICLHCILRLSESTQIQCLIHTYIKIKLHKY